MFDCGLQHRDEKRFPDFSWLSSTPLDLVLISAPDVKHCGSLAYFTERCGYTGPVLTTYPIRAILPFTLVRL